TRRPSCETAPEIPRAQHLGFLQDKIVFLFAVTMSPALTSSGVIGLAIYELSRQPQLQARLRRDIRAALSRHGGGLTYEVLQQMKYLDMLVSETLRKYPPVSCLERRSVRDYVIPGSDVTLKKGCSIAISLLGIHHDPQYYPEPGLFDPERFGDNLSVQSAFLPFGDGPRKCLGEFGF
ncbi:unnamed protein product, partial [Timema podura]|nr:unnamed protein product [Timema podura]